MKRRTCPLALLLIPLLLAPVSPARAENPYLLAVERTNPDPKTIKKKMERLQTIKPVEIRSIRDPAPFHKRRHAENLHQKSFCLNCHLSPPHRKNPRLRTFLNGHVRSLACLTCHYRPDDIPLTHDWRWFGPSPSPATPAAGHRITPLWRGETVTITREHPFAQTIEKQWQNADLPARARLQARLHEPLTAQKMPCRTCHRRRQALLDWTALGMDDERKKALQHHLLPRFLDRLAEQKTPLRLTDLLR